MGCWSERWRIWPLELPRPWRYCASCATARAFECSERFRVNANKKSLDVWLNYRCALCEDVWKFPLFERRTVCELGGAQLDAFARHDQALVWRYAFDVARLKLYAIKVDSDVRVQVERTSLACDYMAPGQLCIHFDVPFPCDIRLDRLLAGELGISRSSLERRVVPELRDALRKRVRDGQIYRLSRPPQYTPADGNSARSDVAPDCP
jgi:hypothetical protein